jgi:hypothetical protein
MTLRWKSVALPVAWLVLAGTLSRFQPGGEGAPAAGPGGGGGGLGLVSEVLLFGGFRVLLFDALWLQADAQVRRGRFHEVPRTLATLTRLEPGLEEVWDFGGWLLGIQVALREEDRGESFRWVQEAFRFLEDGLARHPGSRRLRRRMAFLLLAHEERFAGELARAGIDPPVAAVRWMRGAVTLPGAGPEDRGELEGALQFARRIAVARAGAGDVGGAARLVGGLLQELERLGSAGTKLFSSTVRALEDARAALEEEAEALRLRSEGREADARARAERVAERYRSAIEPWMRELEASFRARWPGVGGGK